MALRQEVDTFGTRGLPETQSSSEALARRAVALDDADAEAHSRFASTLLMRGEQGAADRYLRSAAQDLDG